MATRLFDYGQVKTVPKQNEWLPGVFATAHGVNLNKAGYKDADLSIEYGEIVELSQNGLDANAGYNVTRVDANTTVFGVILRTTDGQIGMEDEWVERPRSKTAVSVYPLASVNNFMVAVPVEEDEVPVVGEAVYVSVVDGSEGSVREDVDTDKGVALTGWVYAGAKYKATKGDGYAVVIQRTL
jgi:hypothetical protein